MERTAGSIAAVQVRDGSFSDSGCVKRDLHSQTTSIDFLLVLMVASAKTGAMKTIIVACL